MSNELIGAQNNLAAAEKARTEAAHACVVEEAKLVIEEIRQLGDRRKYLRDVLRGVSLATASQEQYRAFETLKAGAMHDPSVAQLAYPPSAPESTRYWKEFHAALLSDPNAQLGQPPAAGDLWS
jgi:hypothetical protein